MIKRFFAFFLCFAVFFNLSALADTDVNVDGGGGGNLGTGSSDNYWTSGDDGVRVTVVDPRNHKIVSKPVDFSNKQHTIDYYFGMGCKFHYTAWANSTYSLSMFYGNTYRNIIPKSKLPKIIYGDGKNNIEAIRNHFRDKETLKYICQFLNFDYTKLTTEGYALIIEPVVYLTFNGYRFAMTATEAALYNQSIDGKLASTMGSLTHCNLPRSMYLEHEDLGLKPPKQPFPSRSSFNDILNTLGIAVIRFTVDEQGEDVVVPLESQYYTDTHVITSFNIRGTFYDITPSSSEIVEFNANGQTSIKGLVCPANQTQLMWVKWHTPKKPGTYKIKAKALGKEYTVNATVVDFGENIPPDTAFEDKKPANWYLKPYLSNYKKNLSATWGQWEAYLHGTGEEQRWEFRWVTSKMELNVKTYIQPDDCVKTDIIHANDDCDLKSGYGVNVHVYTSVICQNAGGDDYTEPQIVSARFPEFYWKTYNRLLEKSSKERGKQKWELKINPCSERDYRIQYTPLWYPDKTRYPVYVDVMSAWTPAGELFYTKADDRIMIDGNVYDDWYIKLEEATVEDIQIAIGK